MKYENREISASEVARLLAVSERHAEALLKDHLVAGRQLRSGVWLTSKAAVDRYLATAQRGRGRALSAATAWGLLWELSGQRPKWLSASTLARVRQQIATSSAEEIVRSTSGRTRARFYSLLPAVRGGSWDGLIRTGRPAARHLGVRVHRLWNYSSGYVREGTSDEYAREHGLFEDYEGSNVLFDNTLPVPLAGLTMPDAVIAVDLTLTGGDYERARGTSIIARLQREWMSARQRS